MAQQPFGVEDDRSSSSEGSSEGCARCGRSCGGPYDRKESFAKGYSRRDSLRSAGGGFRPMPTDEFREARRSSSAGPPEDARPYRRRRRGQAHLLHDHLARLATPRRRRAASAPGPRIRRSTPSSTTSSGRSAPTSTAGACTRRWSTGRPRSTSRTSPRTSRSTPATGRPRRRSCTPRRSTRSPARRPDRAVLRPGRGAPAQADEADADSPSTARTSRLRPSRQAWWTSTTCSSPRAWSAAASGSSLDGVRLDLELVEERTFAASGLIHARYRTR